MIISCDNCLFDKLDREERLTRYNPDPCEACWDRRPDRSGGYVPDHCLRVWDELTAR